MFGEPEEFFAKIIESGGHRNSARMVADGSAEVAAIDAVCWDMLRKFEVETSNRLRVVGWTAKRPSLPMITSLSTSDTTLNLLRKTLKTVSQMPEAHALGITGFVELPISDYHALSML
jgi:ABC-type phosphate/phosphonate transport system substrate-binding protein